MAHIVWINHPTDPSLNGKPAHVKTSVADYAIEVKQAVPYHYKSFQEYMAEHEKQRQATLTQPDPNFVQGVQYSVHERMYGSINTGHAYVTRKSGAETLFFDTLESIPADCPKNIVVRFLELNKVGDPEALAEARVQENFRQQNEAQKQREQETSVAVRKFGMGVLRP